MRVAIHQPEHLPWLGYFAKLAAADIFVILDDTQYEKNYFQNRNRVEDNTGFPHWLTVTVDLPQGHRTEIKDVLVSSKADWRTSYFGKLRHSLSNRKFYHPTVDWLRVHLDSSDYLAQININVIRDLSERMGLNTQFLLASELKVAGSKSARLIEILSRCSATEYLIGKGSLRYLDFASFRDAGLSVLLVESEISRNRSLDGLPLSCLQEITRLGIDNLRAPVCSLKFVEHKNSLDCLGT